MIDWLTVADARALVAPAPPAAAGRRRPRMMFDGSYRPVDQVIREMWAGQGRATQEEALSIPGVLRARNLICSVATWPQVDLDRANVRHRNPLLEQFDPHVANSVTKAQVMQDLLFEGVAWLRVLSTDQQGYPTHMEHLAWHRVTLQPLRSADGQSPMPGDYVAREDGTLTQIYVDGEPADHRMIKRVDSPNPGVLKAAGATIKLAATYRTTALLYADNPRMDGYLAPKEGADPVQDEAVADILDAWEESRRQHTTGYVPAALGYEKVENLSPADLQLVQLQEQATRDVALALGLEPADLGVSSQTETYSNRVDKRIDRINDLLGPYVTAWDERLSMGDITRNGHRVWSDPTSYLKAAPADRVAYYQGMQALGVLDADDIADAENYPRKPRAATPASGNVVPIRQPATSSPSRLAAGGNPVTFDGVAQVVTDPARQTFAHADVERRIISGTAVPYGRDAIARKNGRKYRFQRGSIVWPDPRHVPLLVDHVQSASVGHFARIVDGPDGRLAAARGGAARGGDQALTWASPEESVRTGFSVGVDFDHADCVPDPENPGVWLVPVGAAQGVEISLVAVPAFRDARVASVTMAAENGESLMRCSLCGHVHAENVACPPPAQQQFANQQTQAAGAPAQTPAPAAPTSAPPAVTLPTGPAYTPGPTGFTADQMWGMLQAVAGQQPQTFAAPPQAPAGPQFVDPTRGGSQQPQGTIRHSTSGPRIAGPAQVTEAAPYRFDREGNLAAGPQYDFSADLVRAGRDRDGAAYDRALGFMREMTVGDRYGMRPEHYTFADVDRADVTGLNPVRNRPDMYVPQRDYAYPLTQATRRGTLADITSFTLPKFNASAGLVSPHTEGVEPTPGSFSVTTQTIVPTARSGAIDMTREAWDQGGTPQATALIWQQFVREWNEELESGVATFLNTLTAAADILIAAGSIDKALAKIWKQAIARLQFARGGAGRFDTMATEQELYVALATAETTDGASIFPMLSPQNRDGQAAPRYTYVDAAGVRVAPSWALSSTAGAPNNSWLFDSQVVHTWDTGPQRLEFPGINSTGDYSPVAYVRLAVWGYQALANTDITGVRQVIYDTVP
jgi:hypothetical protein